MGSITAEAISTDIYETDKTFDLVVGNPPYFAGQRIGDIFIKTAMRYLNDTGRLAIVSKHGDQLLVLLKTLDLKQLILEEGTAKYSLFCLMK